jgi:hypothetical protein
MTDILQRYQHRQWRIQPADVVSKLLYRSCKSFRLIPSLPFDGCRLPLSTIRHATHYCEKWSQKMTLVQHKGRAPTQRTFHRIRSPGDINPLRVLYFDTPLNTRP